jgi:hypothetical protein
MMVYWGAFGSADAHRLDPASGKVKISRKDDVGATLVVALLADAVRKAGDHKGRPYSRQFCRTPFSRQEGGGERQL